MSWRNSLILPVVLFLIALGALVGCGGGSGAGTIPNPTPPPSGGFSDSNVNGNYVFSTSGTDVNGAPIMITGAFTACGCSGGTISGGTLTYANGSVGVGTNQAINSGSSYRVTADGRGQATLKTSTSLGTIVLDFVLISGSQGLVTEFDANGSGSGTMEQQATVSQGQLAGSYAFSTSGSGSTGLFATAGAFTLSASGEVTAGVQDVTNLNTTTGAASSQAALAIQTTSTVAVGTGTAPGKAQITSTAGVFTYDVYAVSASHLKFIETDGIDLTSGDVFSEQTALPTGTVAFTMGGLDTSLLPLAVGGLLPVTSGSISGGLEDFNDGGTANTTSSVSGGFAALSGGRSVLTLSGFENGATNGALGTYMFAAYPSSGGTLLLEVDNAGISTGTALAQSTTSFAASKGYGMNVAATNISNVSVGGTPFEEDDIAEFTTTSSAFSGVVDINDQGMTTPNQALSGTYKSGTPAGRYSFTSNVFNGVFYTVDGSSLLFLETDTVQIGTGAIQLQSTPSSSGAVRSPLAMTRPAVAGRHALRKSGK